MTTYWIVEPGEDGPKFYNGSDYFSSAYDKAQRYINERPELGKVGLMRAGKIVAELYPEDDEL